MALIFDTPRLVLNAYAVLIGQTPGSAAFKEHQGYVESLKPDGYKSALNGLLKELPTAQLATALLKNLSLTTVFTQADAEAYLNGATNRVAAMIDLADALYNYGGSIAGLLTAQSAYKANVEASYTYSSNTANINSATLSSIAIVVNPSQTFTLTTGADTIPGLTGSAGTSGNTGDDTISAALQNSGTNGATNESTLNSTDALNAGSGSDVLNVRVASLTGSITVVPTLTSIEKISVTNVDTSSNTATINLISAPDVATIEFKNSASSSTTSVLNAQAAAIIVLDNADGSSAGQNVNFGSNTSRTGTADAFAIQISNGSGSSSLAAGFNLISTDGTSDDTSFEIANISVSGAASFIVAGTAMEKLNTVNITGETTGVTTGFGLELSQVTGFNNLKTVSASGMTGGGLQIDARDSTATGFTFTGSSLADALVLNKDTLNASATLNGGLGKDKLATTSFADVSTAVNRATGFEVLEAITSQSSLEASSFTGIHEFLFSGGSVNGRLNITGVESNDRFIFASDQGNSDESVRFTGTNAGTSLVFEMRASAETNGEVTIIANSNGSDEVSAIGFQSNISSVTVESTGQNAKANLIESVNNNRDNYWAFNNDNGLANFTITGTQALTIAAKEGIELSANTKIHGFSNSANVNASGFSGALRIAGSNTNDVITGGSGNDIIYGMRGNDTLTGNAGADQFRFVGSQGVDIIKDFAKGLDQIGFNNVNFSNTTATSAGATLSALDYIDNRSGITSIGSADNQKVIELQTALSGSQIASDQGAAVTAYILVFNSSTNKGELWFDDNWSDAGSRSQVATFDDVVTLTGVTAFKNTDFVEFTA